MHYELDYALRVCSQNRRTQSCVHIYSQMGLFEEAVELALEVRENIIHFFFFVNRRLKKKGGGVSIIIWILHVLMQINLKIMKSCVKSYG